MDFSRFAYKATTASIPIGHNAKSLTGNNLNSPTSKIPVIDIVSPESKPKSEVELVNFSNSSLEVCNNNLSGANQDNVKNHSRSDLVIENETNIPAGKGLKDLFKSPCDAIEKALRMIIIGHNPSYQSWSKGHYYANPANRMWPILSKSGLVPRHFNCTYDQDCPSVVGIGFTDVLVGFCETNSSNIEEVSLAEAKSGLYSRLTAHCARVSADNNIPIEDAYPRVIAFAGVRQYKALFNDDEKAKKASRKRKASESMNLTSFYESMKSKSQFDVRLSSINVQTETICIDKDDTIVNGIDNSNETSGGGVPELLKQEIESGLWTINAGNEGKTSFGVQLSRPSDWPKVLDKSIIFLLPSTSGAAAMTTEAREGPYFLLSKLLQRLQYDRCAKRGCLLPFWKETENSSNRSFQSVASSSSSLVNEIVAEAKIVDEDVIVIDDS